jgi:FKBP-type peptidyl-prolyl cis-trans isomerase SlyD
MIKNGHVVTFEYTVSDDENTFTETNKGEEPITFTQGAHEIIPGLENAFLGMTLNEEKHIRLPAEDAYGPIIPEYFRELSKSELPPGNLTVGTVLRGPGPNGQEVTVRIHEVKEESVIVDFNHPLAGKALNFDVKVLDVRPGETD